jgi:hypothetical protein
MKHYIQISASMIRGRSFGGAAHDEWIEDVPLIALKSEGSREKIATGRRALDFLNREIVCDPFQTFEMLATDLPLAEEILKDFVAVHLSPRFAFIPPVMLIQPMYYGKRLNPLEKRMFTEMAIHAGAREAWILDQEPTLSETELRKLKSRDFSLNSRSTTEMPLSAITSWPMKSS